MRIAVTYDQGNVFQHFGRTEQFKIYEVEDGKILSGRVCGTGGTGHEALAGLLASLQVDTVICGGLGEGMKNALAAAGITVCPGAEGDADSAVEAYLRGELAPGDANCDHHHEEEEESGGCGGGCGGCGGGCGGCGGEMPVILEGRNAGKRCRVHYRGTLNDGTEFDSSYGRGEPMEFICGTGRMISGFDKAVVDMEPGQTLNVHLMPEEAYGERDPRAVITSAIADMQGTEDLSVGDQVVLMNSMGQRFRVTVTEKDEQNITFDANHELAGKELNFEITLVEVEE